MNFIIKKNDKTIIIIIKTINIKKKNILIVHHTS